MVKKLAALFLCIVILFSLGACSENDVVNTSLTQNTNYQEKSNMAAKAVFDTENVSRITFYTRHGEGEAHEVPSKCMTEITNWLGSFTFAEKVDENNPLDGINTIYVEIEYTNGKVIKNGLDLIVVDGVAYYTKRDKTPDCYWEILS